MDFSLSIVSYKKKAPGVGSLAESPAVTTVVVMVSENNRRQGYTHRKSRTNHHGRGCNRSRWRHIVTLIHGNRAAFLISIGVVGCIGRCAGHPPGHGTVIAGTESSDSEHHTRPSVNLHLHDKQLSPLRRTLSHQAQQLLRFVYPQRIKFVNRAFSRAGGRMPAASAACRHLSCQARLRAMIRMFCIPSASCRTSSGLAPCTMFQ